MGRQAEEGSEWKGGGHDEGNGSDKEEAERKVVQREGHPG
jgi:hypothetical protein